MQTLEYGQTTNWRSTIERNFLKVVLLILQVVPVVLENYAKFCQILFYVGTNLTFQNNFYVSVHIYLSFLK